MKEITFRIRHKPTGKEYYKKDISGIENFDEAKQKFLEDVPEYMIGDKNYILTHNFIEKTFDLGIPNFRL